MGAIACIFSPLEPARVRVGDLELMLRALGNRGRGRPVTHVDSDAGIAIGHVPDAPMPAGSEAHPPLWYEGPSLVVAGDGAVFAGGRGPRALRDLLGSPDGLSPDGDPSGRLGRLDGGFALIGWSRDRRLLWLARDLLGLKPLYYAYRPELGLTIAASQLRGLLAHPDAGRTVDREGLSLFLTCGYATAPFSLVGGVHKVVPGELVEVDAGEAPRGRIFRALPPTAAEERPLEEWADLIRTGLRDAVTLSVADARKPGLLLSGGTDSIALAQVLAGLPRNGVEALTVVYERGRERPLVDAHSAEEAARRLGLRHRVLRIGRDAAPSGWLRSAVREYDEPISTADYAETSDRLARAAAEDGVDVCLTGLQAEFLFGWKRWGRLVGEAGSGAPEPTLEIDRRFADRDRNLETALQPALLVDPIEDPDELLLGLLLRYADEVRTDDPYEAAVGTALRFRIPEAVLALTERYGVLHGVDFRHPFGEARLLELASRIPSRHKGAASPKAIKEALRAAFPWPSEAKGYLPPAAQLRREIDLERDGLLSRAALERGGVFRPDVLDAIREGRIARPTRTLWSMLLVQGWIDAYLFPLVEER
jgi:asparagine synthase (glutamine-hydrolysing)